MTIDNFESKPPEEETHWLVFAGLVGVQVLGFLAILEAVL